MTGYVLVCRLGDAIVSETNRRSKYVIIAAVSFVLIIALYEGLIKRFNIVRFFFGMRRKRTPSPEPAPRPEGTAA